MKNYKFLSLIALLLMVVAGCKDYLDINTNPNAPTVTVPGLVLSGALKATADNLAIDNNDYAAYWGGMMSASGTYSPSGDVRRLFNINSSSFRVQQMWQDYYLNASNYNFVDQNSTAQGAKYGYYAAIAKIMKAYCFQVLVDNYGDIPYSQALTGFKYLSPTYDGASGIYEKLSTQLDTAVTIIQAGMADGTWSVPPATVDIMFHGDMSMWVKLANTMNLRLLLHQSEIGGAKDTFIAGEITKINNNAGGFLSVFPNPDPVAAPDENALINPGYQKATGLQNPFWETNGLGVGNDIGGRDYNRCSDYAVTTLAGLNDPRSDRYFRNVGDLPGVSNGTNYFGIPFGQDPDLPYTTQNTSGFGLGVMGSPADPIVFLSAAESSFLQAEAVHRGWITGDEKALYEAGILGSFKLSGAGDPTSYIAQGSVAFPAPGTADALKAIIVQKWIAMYVTDAMEAWTDVRRLGLPDDLPQSKNTSKINPTPPIRLFYPQTEYSNNAGAVKAQETKEGLSGNYQFSKPVFWDVTP